MAGYTDQQLLEVVRPRLQPGEVVSVAAYGERGLPFWARILCMLAMIPGVVPGVILFIVWTLLATKNFVVALTDRRLIVVQVSGLKPKKAFDYSLPLPGRAAMSHVGRGLNRAELLKIACEKPFVVRFLNSSPTNMENALRLYRGLDRSSNARRG